jgi:molybdopterin/thiamine biosynthesis adenylyltransferase
MPEPLGTVAAIREQALFDADLYLSSRYGALRLAEKEFAPGAVVKFCAGWSLLIQPSTQPRELHLYADSSFPFSRPDFYLLDRPEFLTWPHIERSGKLCGLDNVRIERPQLVSEILRSELTDVFRLVQESEAGTNLADFQREFHSYWDRQAGLSAKPVYSLLDARGPSRMIRFWHGKNWCVVGETEEEIASWLKHRHGNKADYEHSELACLLWFPDPLLPTEYPRFGADLYSLAGRTPEGQRLLRTLALQDCSRFPVLLGAETENGPCFAAVRSHRPKHTDPSGATTPKIRPGFRPGKVPPTLQAQHVFSAYAGVEPMEVNRVDAAWVHGRGRDPRQKDLADKHVVLAGCGSVGAPLAQQLAMAGVGRLALVDPGTLDWPNIGRHPLGAKFIGQSKASAMAEFLQENLPHLHIDGFVGTLAEFLGSDTGSSPANLIISATADWTSERMLNLDHVDGQITSPILFTWTEPHACAGHAVYLPAAQPCLQCGFTLGGDLLHPVTRWPQNMPNHLSEPACGAHFQPYGPIELMGTVSAAASLALDALLGKTMKATHRVWAGPFSLLEESGGAWTDAWLGRYPDRNQGAFQETITWQEDPACSACGAIHHQALVSTSASLSRNS